MLTQRQNVFEEKRGKKNFGVVMKREKGVFHWVGCLLTIIPTDTRNMQSIHFLHEKVFCIISFENVLKTWRGFPGINSSNV